MKKDDDYTGLLLLLLLFGGVLLMRGRASVTFSDPLGNPIDIQPADGAIDRLADGRCFQYFAAENSWYPVQCPGTGPEPVYGVAGVVSADCTPGVAGLPPRLRSRFD